MHAWGLPSPPCRSLGDWVGLHGCISVPPHAERITSPPSDVVPGVYSSIVSICWAVLPLYTQCDVWGVVHSGQSGLALQPCGGFHEPAAHLLEYLPASVPYWAC